MSRKARRIVAVLGMHRSGTSAVTRGLAALGVDLGEKLMPAIPGNNDRGFFEDVDVNRLNIELLGFLGRNWDALAPVRRQELDRADLEPFMLRAVDILRERLAAAPAYGVKDPRISVLLPFWRKAFERVGAEVAYVHCVRNPLSVAKSLERRDGFATEKSLYLWLEHVAAVALETQGERSLVASYDLLMSEPKAQLARIARALDLPFDAEAGAFAEFARDFLTEELRHGRFTAEDLAATQDLPLDVLASYQLLERLARDAPERPAQVAAHFRAVQARLDEMRPALAYASRRDMAYAELDEEAQKLRREARAMQDQINGRDEHIHSLNRAAGVRDAYVAVLDNTIAGLNARVVASEAELEPLRARLASMEATGAERQQRIEALERGAAEHNAEREALLVALRQAQAAHDNEMHALRERLAQAERQVAERDARIAELGREIAGTENRAAEITRALAERDADLARREQALEHAVAGVQATLAVEAAAQRRAKERVAGLRFGRASAPGAFAPLARSLERLAQELERRHHEASLEPASLAAAVSAIEAASRARAAAADQLADAGVAIEEAVLALDNQLEVSRLRLVDALRESARERAELAAQYAEARAAMARQEAEIAHQRQVLAQFPHQFVSRLGAILDPYPGLRAFLTAPLRLVHRMLGTHT